jgi:general secretion pathway protein G
MNTTRLSTARGFTLIELLIVATIIGVIVAIAVPNLLNSIQRARQARTMADVNAIGKGLSMYQQDEILFPIAAKDTHAEAIRQHIVHYISSFNPTDGWKKPFLYTSTDGRHYTLISYGMDSAASEPYSPGPTMFFDDDLVMVDGMFLQYPDGPQQ